LGPLAAALFLAHGVPSAGLGQESTTEPETPRLVLLLVVDQLRADLVSRYDDLYTGGFRRLMDEGRVYPNATHDHLVTETAPGHATIATGTHPSRHGVVSNHWYEVRNGQWVGVENVLDRERPVLGAEEYVGAAPLVLLRDGLADWLAGSRASSRRVSVSGKPRGAVLLGGLRKGDVYWFEPAVGRFVTSVWYRDEVPAWVTAFNEQVVPGFARDSVWESTVPPEAAGRSRPDSVTYEGGGVNTSFPHSFESARKRYPEIGFWTWFSLTPSLDRATLAFARAAVEARDMGGDDVPDLLTVSLSQTDRVGHDYGPLSREQLDNLLRLDAELGAFFDFLDEAVGQGRWLVGLTADHGAQDAPEWEMRRGVEALRLNRDSLLSLQDVLQETARSVGSTDPSELAGPLARQVERLPWVARAWSRQDIEQGEPADSFDVLAWNAHHPDRPTGLLGRRGVDFMVRPHVLPFGYADGGSTHQSGYYHDRHVPFVLMGPGVAPGTDTARVSAADLAPTLAALLGLETPDDLDGVALRVDGR
jgi:predicted AlkP superfamily pyrophosphatase or phosphodiesterase